MVGGLLSKANQVNAYIYMQMCFYKIILNTTKTVWQFYGLQNTTNYCTPFSDFKLKCLFAACKVIAYTFHEINIITILTVAVTA
jgi:hypothetical protein